MFQHGKEFRVDKLRGVSPAGTIGNTLLVLSVRPDALLQPNHALFGRSRPIEQRIKRGVQLPGLETHQISRTLCSMVLITSSIFPFSTCLAMLKVNPLAVWK